MGGSSLAFDSNRNSRRPSVGRCGLGMSLRSTHRTAFQKVVLADVTQQTAEDRAHLRTLAFIVFDALELHEESCLLCGTELDA